MPTKRRRKPRTRYIAELTNGKSVDVLAYSLEQAHDVLRQHGKSYTSVTRKTADVVRRKVGGGWRLNRAGVQAVSRELGLEFPVLVKQTSRVGSQAGAHYLRMDAKGRLYHHITVKSYDTPEEANKTLRHELRHAWQAEQAIARAPEARGIAAKLLAWERYRKSQHDNYTYRRRPIEIDANRFAAKPSTISLALPNRS